MLHDEHLVGAAVEYIRDEKINAEWALRRAVDDIRGVFDQHRGRVPARAAQRRRVRVRARAAQPARPRHGPAVAAARRDRRRVRPVAGRHRARCTRPRSPGLLTDAGGKTSHTAIIARAHEIPAVVGLENITELVETDDLLLIDGGTGTVIVNPSATTVAQYRDEQRRQVAAGVRAARDARSAGAHARRRRHRSCSRTSTAPTSSTTRSSTARWASACSAPSTCS